ncbi:hypothetical protein WG66_008044 [Moniliophthora roreri]|nr:hypothetical protein WG66_008044 [Moniliophthora roreri]
MVAQGHLQELSLLHIKSIVRCSTSTNVIFSGSNSFISWEEYKPSAERSLRWRDSNSFPKEQVTVYLKIRLKRVFDSVKALAFINQPPDLVPGMYEGGLKTWECSLDAIDYLGRLNENEGFTIEGNVCWSLPVQDKPTEVHLWDYNTSHRIWSPSQMLSSLLVSVLLYLFSSIS